MQCPYPWGWNGCGNKKKPQVFLGFVGVAEGTKDADGITNCTEWGYVAKRLDGLFVNLDYTPLSIRQEIYGCILSKRAVIPYLVSQPPADTPSLKLSLKEMQLFNYSIVGSEFSAGTLGNPNTTWKNFPPAEIWPAIKWFQTVSDPPVHTFFTNVKTSVALNGSIRNPDRAEMLAWGQGAIVELAACRAFERGKPGDYELGRFVPAMKKLEQTTKRKLFTGWQAVIYNECPDVSLGGGGKKRHYVEDLKKAYRYLKKKDAIPDAFFVLAYEPGIPVAPERDARGGYPNTLTGAARWLLDTLDKDFK